MRSEYHKYIFDFKCGSQELWQNAIEISAKVGINNVMNAIMGPWCDTIMYEVTKKASSMKPHVINKKILGSMASTNPNHPVSLPKMPFLAFSSAFHFPMCIMMLFDTIGANLVCP